MSDATDPPTTDTEHGLTDDEDAGKTWNAPDVMRERAAKTRSDRDTTIAELRAAMSDQEVLDEFGINLGEIER